MATKPETTFYTAVNKLIPPHLHKEKMTNPYRGGTADFWYSGNYGDLWVEYKWLAKAPKTTITPGLSALQLKWLRERHEEGRNVAVIIGSPEGNMLMRDKTWEQASAPDFNLSRRQLAAWITEEIYRAD